MQTRILWLGAAVLATGLGAGECPEPPSEVTGLVPEEVVEARAREYLEFATAQQTASILNAIAHMERDRVDPSYTAPTGVVDETTWQGAWDDLDQLQDTRDFDGLYLLNALLGYEDHPYLTPEAWDRVRDSLHEFKMWAWDATPPQPDPNEPARDWDNSFYWTENHQILFHTIEYLMGQREPDRCFVIRGFTPTGYPTTDPRHCSGEVVQGGVTRRFEQTGAEHRDRARAKILAWLDDRWQAGFSEWFSNIYLQKDATPLLTLAEYAEDEEIRTRATMILDMLLLDMAANTFRGVLGVTHGRSAIKDKNFGPRNDTWGITQLLFEQDQEYGYQSTGDAGATLFARAKHYRMPAVLAEMARSDETFVNRTRQSFLLDERAAGAIDPGDPSFPPGHPYAVSASQDETNERFTFWWGLGAYTVWQVVPLTLLNAELYNLWDTELLKPFQPLRDATGGDPVVGVALAKSLWESVAVGFLKEANTYTYRTRDYILSTAQDFRKGANAGQLHSWQATLSAGALVFTTHPMIITRSDGSDPEMPSVWLSEDEGEPGYWTGTASSPRSAQHENVGIHLYSPIYPPNPLGTIGIDFFDYHDYTHAWFNRDQFDEWSQSGAWTFGRKGDAYVALYSWRPTAWRDIPADELALMPPSENGPISQSFELTAPGGPDNVWIVECGSKEQWGSFGGFQEAILLAQVVVTPRPSDAPEVQGLGLEVFDVRYDSPSQGVVTFGWDEATPLTLRGEEVPIRDYPRVANPWVQAQRGDPAVWVEGETAGLLLDWTDVRRSPWD